MLLLLLFLLFYKSNAKHKHATNNVKMIFKAAAWM
jgi:hypothetical protein